MFNKNVKIFSCLVYITELIFLCLQLTASAKSSPCHIVTFINTTWIDRRPHFVVNMTFHPKGVINTVTTVNKEIPSPVTHLSLEQKEDGERATTLYNITTKLCDVQSFLKKVPMLKTILNASLKQGNYSFNCPMKKGVYLMENIRISSRSPLLSLIYRPKAVYHLHGGVFEEMTDKSLLPFCAYDFYFRIVKRQCSD